GRRGRPWARVPLRRRAPLKLGPDALRADEGREPLERLLQGDLLLPCPPPDALDLEDAGLTVENGVDSPHEVVAVEDGEDEVAVLPLLLRDVDLDLEVEVPEREVAFPVAGRAVGGWGGRTSRTSASPSGRRSRS